MKNYIVKALRVFDDYEGLEIKPENPHVRRIMGKTFNCTKERYEHLKSKCLVKLMGIEKAEEEVPEIEDGTLEHPYKTIMPEPIEELKEEKPKKKPKKKK